MELLQHQDAPLRDEAGARRERVAVVPDGGVCGLSDETVSREFARIAAAAATGVDSLGSRTKVGGVASKALGVVDSTVM